MVLPISETVIPVGFKRETVVVPHKHYPTHVWDIVSSFTLAGAALVVLLMFLVKRAH